MRITKAIHTFLLTVACTCHSFAQTSRPEELETFDLFFTQPTVVSPAYINKAESLNGSFIYHALQGDFSEVQTLSGNLVIRLKELNNGTSLHTGLNYYSAQEGPFIRSTRFYGHFATTVPLTEESYLAAGAHLGYIDALYGEGAGLKNPRDGAFITNIGVHYSLKESFFVGLSVHNVVKQELRPLDGTITLPETFNVYTGGTYVYDKKWSAEGEVILKSLGTFGNQFKISPRVVYKGAFALGGAYTRRNILGKANISMMNFFVGMRNLDIGEPLLNIYFNYRFLLSSLTIPEANSMEIGLSVYLR